MREADVPYLAPSADRMSSAIAAALSEDQRQTAMFGLSPARALTCYGLLFPALVEYRGAWFTADGFTEGWADGWFAQPGLTISQIERVCSHIHILADGRFGLADDEIFPPQREPAEVGLALAEIVAFSWKAWAKARYGLALETFIEPNEDEAGVYDYEVSFQRGVEA